MKKTFALMMTALLLAFLFLTPSLPAWAGEGEVWELGSSEKGLVLEDGAFYEVLTDVTIKNSALGGSGITLPENARVCIYVAEGATLRVIGGDGEETAGGGAGILVPKSSTLVLMGKGTVEARGGNAGNGGNGADGENGAASREGNYYYGGRGGAGGNGGGGAGAGIGTGGGNGASGGNQNNYSYLYRRVDEGYGLYVPEADTLACLCEPAAGDTSGMDGANGAAGRNANAPGTIFILDSLTVNARSGEAGHNGSGGAPGAGATTAGFGWMNYYAAGGGGGGGAGHGGYAAETGIGPGGSGGGAGGQGGSGGTYWSAEAYLSLDGAQGGVYDDVSGSGEAGTDPVIAGASWGGFGGHGGGFARGAGQAVLVLDQNARAEGGPEGAAVYHENDPRVSFLTCHISYLDMGGEDFTGVRTVYYTDSFRFGQTVALPERASRAGCRFEGWFLDPLCKDGPVTEISPEWGAREVKVYARWTSGSSAEKEPEKADLSRELEIALFATGGIVILSFLLFFVLRSRYKAKQWNRRVRR